jgi:hypothetical protein
MRYTPLASKLATTVRSIDDGKSIVFHWTEIVRFDHETIILDTNGWKTVTTKRRMNQAADEFGLGYHVYQENWDWFVDYRGETYPFVDGKVVLER